MLQCEKPVDRNSIGFSNTNDRETIIRATFIVIHGIRVDKDYANFVPETFGRLTTIGPKFWMGQKIYQVCQCDCGGTTVVRRSSLTTKNTQSCGCLYAQTFPKVNVTHGLAGTPIYRLWVGMFTRCNNKKEKSYKDYGGRGIHVCARWREPNGQGFLNFVEDMGPRPGPEYTIERKEVNGNYCPENCEWIPSRLQGRNKRNSRMLTAFGKTQCVAAWAEEYAIPAACLSTRLRRGWDVVKAITTEPKKKVSNG